MKTIKTLIFGMLLLFAATAEAQVSVHLNIGTPPQWGPAGYTDVRYYYLPDVEAYYDVPSSQFIYFNGVSWIHRSNLPGRYRNYDLYNGYKVVMTDYRGNTPYIHFKEYKSKYAKGYHGKPQKNYGERPGQKSSKEMKYSKGYENQKRSKENKGQGKGKKK